MPRFPRGWSTPSPRSATPSWSRSTPCAGGPRSTSPRSSPPAPPTKRRPLSLPEQLAGQSHRRAATVCRQAAIGGVAPERRQVRQSWRRRVGAGQGEERPEPTEERRHLLVLPVGEPRRAQECLVCRFAGPLDPEDRHVAPPRPTPRLSPVDEDGLAVGGTDEQVVPSHIEV